MLPDANERFVSGLGRLVCIVEDAVRYPKRNRMMLVDYPPERLSITRSCGTEIVIERRDHADRTVRL